MVLVTHNSLEALLAAELQPDIDEDLVVSDSSDQSNQVTPESSPIGMNTASAPTGDVDDLDEDQKKQMELDEILRLQWEADNAKKQKTPPKVLKANDAAEILASAKKYKDTATSPTKPMSYVQRTPNRPISYHSVNRSGGQGLPRSPCLDGLMTYHDGEKTFEGKIMYDTFKTIDHPHPLERRDMMKHQKQVDPRAPVALYFSHGIFYHPTNEAQDQGFRTIMIPVGLLTNIQELIDQRLCGKGQIYHAQILQTRSIKSAAGNNTANITFVTQPEWIDDNEALKNLCWFPDALPYKLESKTWPMSEKTIKDIATGYTRVVTIFDVPQLAKFDLVDLANKLHNPPARDPCYFVRDHHILKACGDGIDKITIEFNSIETASGFLHWIQKERHFLGHGPIKYRFERDCTMTSSQLAAHVAFGSSGDVDVTSDGPRATPSKDSTDSVTPTSTPTSDDDGMDEIRGMMANMLTTTLTGSPRILAYQAQSHQPPPAPHQESCPARKSSVSPLSQPRRASTQTVRTMTSAVPVSSGWIEPLRLRFPSAPPQDSSIRRESAHRLQPRLWWPILAAISPPAALTRPRRMTRRRPLSLRCLRRVLRWLPSLEPRRSQLERRRRRRMMIALPSLLVPSHHLATSQDHQAEPPSRRLTSSPPTAGRPWLLRLVVALATHLDHPALSAPAHA